MLVARSLSEQGVLRVLTPFDQSNSKVRLRKSLSLSTVSTAARLVAALATFSVVARTLGPEQFGVLMLCMSIASLLLLISNFGLTTFLLREIGRRPDAAAELFGHAFGAKLLISGPVLLLGLVPLAMLHPETSVAYLLVLGAMWFEGLTEFANAGLRARQQFGIETRLAITAAIINAATVMLTAWYTASLLHIAAAYLVSRAVVALFAWRAVTSTMGRIAIGTLATAQVQLRSSIHYAIDTALTSAFGLVDSLVLNHFLGPLAVGLHQAGMRLFMAGQQAATVLANVFLPRASAAHSAGGSDAAAEFARLQWAFLAVGAGFGLLMAAAARWYVVPIFGVRFESLLTLMPWFGLLFAVKFAAAAWGVVLTAQGHQSYRAAASAAHWFAVAVVANWSVPRYGNEGWLMALVVGNAFLGVLYAARAAKDANRNWRVVTTTVTSLLCFIPFLHWP